MCIKNINIFTFVVSNRIFAHFWSQIEQNMSNFHKLEVVGRGSETQLQVGENSNYLI